MRTKISSEFLRNTIWSLVQQVGAKSIGMITILSVARLSGPDDFGFALSLLAVIALLELVLSTGLVEYVVLHGRGDSTSIGSLHCFCITVTFFALIFVFLILNSTEQFHSNSWFITFYILFSIGLLFNSAAQIPIGILRSERKFSTLAKNSLIGGCVGLVVSIMATTYFDNGIGVPLNYLAVSTCVALFGLKGSAWNPSMVIMPKLVIDSYRQILPIYIHRVVDVGHQRVFELCIGRFASVTQLGNYALALRLQTVFLQVCVGSIGSVVMSYFVSPNGSNIQRHNFLSKCIFFSSVLTSIPLLVGARHSEFVVFYSLGAEWGHMSTLIKNVCYAGVITSLFGINSYFFTAVSKSKYNTIVSFSKALCILLLVVFYSNSINAEKATSILIVSSMVGLCVNYSILTRYFKSLNILKGPIIAVVLLISSFKLEVIFNIMGLHSLPVYVGSICLMIVWLVILILFVTVGASDENTEIYSDK